MTTPHLPTRRLRDRPDLDQLKRQAKELLDGFTAGDAASAAEVRAHFHDADPATFSLQQAQLVLARAYGFESWPKFKAFVDGATVDRLIGAVRDGRLEEVRALLHQRPELARMSKANFGVIHYAVLDRQPEVVRLLMQHGASARQGVYPHREATTAHALAAQRGYADIVRIIEEAEQQWRDAQSGGQGTPVVTALLRSIAAGETARAVEALEASPEWINARHVPTAATPLHIAAETFNAELVAWLLEHGAEVNARNVENQTPLDRAARRGYRAATQLMTATAKVLLDGGAEMTPAAAAALADAEWLRARHAAGTLTNDIDPAGGLLRIAITHDRPHILRMLLDFGFDPDERIRVDDGDAPSYSWGMALSACASTGKYEMAEMLLQRGADPNASIEASGDPIFWAFSEGDDRMVALLERYGGIPTAASAGLFRKPDLARRMISGEAPYRIDGAAGASLGEQLLWGSACGGDPEILRLALERVDWQRDDPRWFNMLEQTLRHWAFGSATEGWDKHTYLVCFRMLLDRCDPNLRGRPTDDQQFGLTTLHNIVARGDMAPGERVAYATAILEAGARLDMRDHLLESTPLGWACRWGHRPLVELFLDRGADPIEADAEGWATPAAWAARMNHTEILELLQR